jgi:hypothetical protein
MTIDESGSMDTLEQRFGKQCSTEAEVVKIVYEGGYVVHKNMVFYDTGDTGVLCSLLQKVSGIPVSRGTDSHPLDVDSHRLHRSHTLVP